MQIVQRNLPAAAQTERSEIPTARTDAVLCDRARNVFALSSGPPALGAGQPAAKVFLDTVSQHLGGLVRSLEDVANGQGSWKRTRTVFRGIFEIASETIRTTYGHDRVPATSGTVMVTHRGVAAVAHIGLTRGYVIRGGKVVRLTTDFRDEVEAEERTQLAMAPQMGRGKQAMGQKQPLHVDGVTFKLASGSTICLVSEGVAGIVRGRELLAMRHQMPDLQGLAAGTVRLAATRQVVADCSVVAVGVP